MTKVNEVIETLNVIERDNTVPKNVRAKIKSTISMLEETNGSGLGVAFDKVLQELDLLSEDPNLPAYTRTQIWCVVSTLESK